MIEGISGLMKSRKAVGLMFVTVALTVLAAMGRMEIQQYLDVLEPLFMAWLGTHTAEQIGLAIAKRNAS